MWKSKLLRSRAARATVRPAFAASADTPASASPAMLSPSSDNLRATSAAVAELVEGLDFVFDQLNYEEEPGDLLQLHLERLMDEASKYRNASLTEGVGTEWTCSPETIQLLLATCQCSSLVYNPMSQPGPGLRPVMSRAPSAAGTEKALSMWKMDAGGTLVVSVRGTASVADHMVNLNADPKRAGSMFEFESVPAVVLAHGGFLTCARSLLPLLWEELSRQVDLDSTLSEVILTGHSAGGAVSSLMFLHLLCRAPEKLSKLKFSLVTFGSAPVLSTNLTEIAAKCPSAGFALAFVNEYDIVPRADRPYVRSIVDLYRSRYGLPSLCSPAPTQGAAQMGGTSTGASTLSDSDGASEQDPIKDEIWALPKPTYHVVGDIIILRSLWVPTSSSAQDPLEKHVIAVRVSQSEFQELLFCDLGVHKRKVYLQNMEMLQKFAGGQGDAPTGIAADAVS